MTTSISGSTGVSSTSTQLVGWVQSALGAEQVASIEAGLATSIANQANPPVVTPPLLWSA